MKRSRKEQDEPGGGPGAGPSDEIARLIEKARASSSSSSSAGGAESAGGPKKKKRKKHRKATTPAQDSADADADPLVSYPYVVDAADHCETPVEAYSHISGLLQALAQSLGKARSSLRIYDPYFCEGGMVERLRALGFENVYNRKEDFYQAIAQNGTPEFDVLVTNPPYSAEHVPRLLSFCRASGKPWFVLVPNYCYTKPYYAPLLDPAGAAQYFYIAPKKRYLYLTPKGRRQQKSGKVTSPFCTFWYCHVPPASASAMRIRELVRANVDASQVDVSFGTPSHLPLLQLDERDERKKKEKNALKRKKNSERKKKKNQVCA